MRMSLLGICLRSGERRLGGHALVALGGLAHSRLVNSNKILNSRLFSLRRIQTRFTEF